MKTVLDHGSVELVESWGSDEAVISAARMSTQGGFKGWGDDETSGDERLLSFLWKNRHSTPFEFCGLTFEMNAPIFVVREAMRHRTFSYSEASARYAPLPDMNYIPSCDRLRSGGQAASNRQSSGAPLSEDMVDAVIGDFREAYGMIEHVYQAMLKAGVAREIARCVLPVGRYSRFRMTGNLRNWLAFLTLRQAPNAQFEIREYADAVAEIIADKFPRTYALYSETK